MARRHADRSARHGCAVLTSAEQAWEVLTNFTADGIEREERVLVAGLRVDQSRGLLQRLREEDGVHCDAAMADGQIVVIDDADAPDFVPQRTKDLTDQLTAQVAQAIRDGYRGIRVTGLHRERGVGRHEAALDQLVGDIPLTVLCPYFAADLSDPEVEYVRAIHQVEIPDDAVYDDGFLRITRPRRGWVKLAGHWNATHHTEAFDVVARAAAAGDRDVDVASLRSIDRTAMVALLTEIQGGLRLRSPQPQVKALTAELAEYFPTHGRSRASR
ncbi:MEDS domain-containing protein [Nakamurella sp. GG22]